MWFCWLLLFQGFCVTLSSFLEGDSTHDLILSSTITTNHKFHFEVTASTETCYILDNQYDGNLREFSITISNNTKLSSFLNFDMKFRTDLSHCLFYTTNKFPYHEIDSFCSSSKILNLEASQINFSQLYFHDSLSTNDDPKFLFANSFEICLKSSVAIFGTILITVGNERRSSPPQMTLGSSLSNSSPTYPISKNEIRLHDTQHHPKLSDPSAPSSDRSRLSPFLSSAMATSTSPILALTVNLLVDSAANSSSCDPSTLSSSSGCNLRSAFSLCNSSLSLFSNLTCVITLPPQSRLFMENSQGPIIIEANSGELTMVGNDCEIISFSSPVDPPSQFLTILPLLIDSSYLRVHISNCSVSGFGVLSSAYNYFGGALLAQSIQSISLSHVNFSSNFAEQWGGAVFFESIVFINILDCVFVNNSAIAGGGLVLDSYPGGVITLIRTVFDSNTASSYGGGIFFSSLNEQIELIECSFMRNYAISGGGAIAFYSNNTGAKIIDSKFLSNGARRKVTGGGTSGHGGAIFFADHCSNVLIRGGVFDANTAGVSAALEMQETNLNFLIEDCVFTHSSSDSDASVMKLSGSNISLSNCNISYNAIKTSDIYFGAVLITNTKGIVIDQCLFEHNSPSALRVTGDNTIVFITNSIFVSDPTELERAVVLDDTIKSGTIDNCLFQGGFSISGSAIYVSAIGGLVVSNSQFIGNVASWGGAVFSINDITFIDCLFKNNKATESGGAVYLSYLSMEFDNCHFVNNVAVMSGGAIASTTSGTLTVNSSIFENNYVVTYGGGAISSSAGYAILIHTSHFMNNSCPLGAGGVEILSDHHFVTMRNNSFVSNKCPGLIGGLYLGSKNRNIIVDHCEFIDNLGKYGGGLCLGEDNSGAELLSLIFKENHAIISGGGMYLGTTTSDVTMNDCHFVSNEAQYGGGLFVDSKNGMTILNSTFVSNSALLTGGGAAFMSDNLIVIKDTTFLLNSALEGGGVSIYSDNTCYLSDTQLTLNTATRKGGGLYLAFRNSANYFDSVIFESNTAQEGGGAYLQSGNDALVMTHCQFLQNTAQLNGGGIFIQDSNLQVTIVDSVFEENISRNYGGGIMLQSSNYLFLLSSSRMIRNSCESAGGTLHSSLYNINLIIDDTVITESQSRYGGSLYLGNDHKLIQLTNLQIIRSTASYGGGVYVSPFSDAFIVSNSSFLDCSADYEGGAIYSFAEINVLEFCEFSHTVSDASVYISGLMTTVSHCLFQQSSSPISSSSFSSSSGSLTVVEGNMLIISHSSFLTNIAYHGGAVNIVTVNSVSITDSVFMNNSGYLGGAIGVDASVRVTVFNSQFTDNEAYAGGGVFLNQVSLANFTTVVFHSNLGSSYGGALLASDADTLFTQCSFSNNSAGTGGSALYLNSAPTVLMNNLLSSNTVHFGAGTVYWMISSVMEEPSGLTDPLLNHFLGNQASYGPNWATDESMLGTSSSVYNITKYGVPIPPILVTLLDVYQQVINIDSLTGIKVVTPNTRNCNGLAGYATGELIEFVSSGMANFSGLQIYCAPGFSLSVRFESTNDYLLSSQQITLNFRRCVRGEYYSAQECVVCEVGTYSLHRNMDTIPLSEMDQISMCQPCPSHALSCFGDVLILKKGFWRISDDSDQIQTCPYGETACEGGDTAGDESCAIGHEGPLCAVCSVGYALKSSTKTCVPCTNSTKLDISEFLLLALLGVILVGVVYYFTQPEIRAQIRSTDDLVLFVITKLKLISLSDGRSKKEMVTFVKILTRRLKARVKVYITMYQILSVLPFVLDLAFPSPVNLIISGLNFINISLSNSSVVSCSTESYDFIDSLLVDTIYPIVLVVILFCVQSIHITLIRRRHQALPLSQSHCVLENRLSNISSTYFTIFLVFTYLILPSVVTKIFQTFRSPLLCPPYLTLLLPPPPHC
jgi:predicted outer membrane repeat protein